MTAIFLAQRSGRYSPEEIVKRSAEKIGVLAARPSLAAGAPGGRCELRTAANVSGPTKSSPCPPTHAPCAVALPPSLDVARRLA